MTVRYEVDAQKAAEITAAVLASKYFDMIDFFTIDQQLVTKALAASASSANATTVGVSPADLRFIQSYFVDEHTFTAFKETYDRMHHQIQEILITMHIDRLNHFTSYIELPRLFDQLDLEVDLGLLNVKKRAIVDMHALRSLSRERVINWLKCVTSLYPMQTIGDGNCLVCVSKNK
jgi:hypothetical protein